MNNSITNPDYEALSESIKAQKSVNIINPLGQDLSQMRTSLLPGALEVVTFNLNRQSKSLKLFELGKTYHRDEKGYKEKKYLTIAISGEVYKENWNVTEQPDSFYYLKGVIKQLLQKSTSLDWEESSCENDIFSEALSYSLQGQFLLHFGFVKQEILKSFNINQEVLYAEIDFDLLANRIKNNDIQYQEIPKYPKVRRDFALLLDHSVSFDTLKKIAFKTDKNILRQVQLFDVYEGNKLAKGKKSYGVSFYFQDPRKTLTDKYVDKVMGKLQQQFETELGAQLR
jgi:phenylalanyl-tRNA synthetase beta chain